MATLIFKGLWGLRLAGNDDRIQDCVESESTAIDARVSVYPLGENHPLATVFGSFDDESFFDDWMNAIHEYRAEVNAREDE
jgi:hypothetical protein